MPYPTLQDDGATVTLDLHGATVAEAIRLTQVLVREAVRRGRRTVKLIHGRSTSDALRQNRTIKHELYALLEGGALDYAVTNVWRAEGHLLLALDPTATPDPAPIRLQQLAQS